MLFKNDLYWVLSTLQGDIQGVVEMASTGADQKFAIE
jgi:hypothetical protein